MRAAEFRAWANGYEKWCHSIEYMGDGLWLGYVDDGVGELSTTDIILEQYTGLKDKNDKKIYEGDIVKYGYKKKYIGQVVLGFIYDSEGYYIEKHYGWGIYRDDSSLEDFADDSLGDFADNNMECEDVEVIGNIHENPELLREEKE